MSVHLATTDSVDADELAAVAARTFPLACPPSVANENITSFIDANLSAAHFARFLSDPRRAILIASHEGRIIGYAMLIRGVADDTQVQRAVELRPAAELSKLYVLADFHGTGVSTELMDVALATADRWSVRCVWLGVNQKNQRAQRFYAKSGFRINGIRAFQLGEHRENDYVMIRAV
ncbi:GNAT family N-acetyltransferase [Mycobacterium canetti]|uniref:GNAT family N-acetyltransferase n=1 Tax=Mycobacterium canetti TaxID=78331 RepID=UPI00059AED20|nr:GNAT family N-acetyltransferase [Mycobacterium canetti]